MLADIAQSHGAEDGVGDGVEQDVGIRMTEEPFLPGNIYSADDQFASFHEAMNIIPVTYSHTFPFHPE
jgi:hypothetical protein